MKYKVFCDLDEVLIDFVKGYLDLTGEDISGTYRTDPAFWRPIDKAGYDFWIDLPWKPDGKKLWKYIEKYNPIILSAPSHKHESRVGKYDWVKREIPEAHLILRSPQNKKEFADKNSILIDDRPENIDSWVGAGGIGILHTSTDKTIKELKKFDL
jgi:5'(3')-deoxyribonucleotidase